MAIRNQEASYSTMSDHGDNLEDSSPTASRGVAEGASNSVATGQWDTAQACAALDALKQWHEKVAQQFRKYKVDGEAEEHG